MKSRPKKEIEQTMIHKGTMDLQNIEREKRLKRREERGERAIALQRGMSTRVTTKKEIHQIQVMTDRKKALMKKHHPWKKTCGYSSMNLSK